MTTRDVLIAVASAGGFALVIIGLWHFVNWRVRATRDRFWRDHSDRKRNGGGLI